MGAQGGDLCFNSTTVQLILFLQILACLRLFLFQFHNGTINTISKYVPSIVCTCFNSTTVQLILLPFFLCNLLR